jgi:beta-N-acetylhexosaminidase
MAVAKHFPGIGRTTLDSHKVMPTFRSSLDELRSCDLIPFGGAIEEDVAGIMLSHILYEDIDPKWPASISPVIARDLLRKEMGYDGVVMTDDLDMGAIADRYTIGNVIGQVLAADVDLALICHEGPNIDRAAEEIMKILSGNPDAMERGRDSLGRILDLKRRYLPFSNGEHDPTQSGP